MMHSDQKTKKGCSVPSYICPLHYKNDCVLCTQRHMASQNRQPDDILEVTDRVDLDSLRNVGLPYFVDNPFLKGLSGGKYLPTGSSHQSVDFF